MHYNNRMNLHDRNKGIEDISKNNFKTYFCLRTFYDTVIKTYHCVNLHELKKCKGK